MHAFAPLAAPHPQDNPHAGIPTVSQPSQRFTKPGCTYSPRKHLIYDTPQCIHQPSNIPLPSRSPPQTTGVGYYRRHSSQREEPSQRTPASGLWCSLADPACQQALLHNWSSKCDILALGDGGGCFVVGSDGSHWYWGVPRSLENKVKGRQKSLAPVEYVALGTDGEYYVQVGGRGRCGLVVGLWSA